MGNTEIEDIKKSMHPLYLKKVMEADLEGLKQLLKGSHHEEHPKYIRYRMELLKNKNS